MSYFFFSVIPVLTSFILRFFFRWGLLYFITYCIVCAPQYVEAFPYYAAYQSYTYEDYNNAPLGTLPYYHGSGVHLGDRVGPLRAGQQSPLCCTLLMNDSDHMLRTGFRCVSAAWSTAAVLLGGSSNWCRPLHMWSRWALDGWSKNDCPGILLKRLRRYRRYLRTSEWTYD